MCLAIPAVIEEITCTVTGAESAIVNLGGVRRQISLALVEDCQVGDYVIIHVGFALQKLDNDEALRTLEMFSEMGDPDELREKLENSLS